jgi:type II secretory pathway component GspD/PulD (secretin)
VAQVLKIYEEVSGRTVLSGQVPDVRIAFRTAAPLNRIEALQMLDTVLAQNHIAMVLVGDKAVKAVPSAAAATESPPEISLPWQSLPESSSAMSRTVHLQHLKPSETMPLLQPLAGLPNSIVPIDAEGILLLRDYSSNIRRQLKLLEELEQKATVK